MSVLQDCVMETGLRETEKRMQSKLEDCWEGPYTVKEKLGDVNYRLTRNGKYPKWFI